MKNHLLNDLKILLCGIAFFAGSIAGGVVAGVFGLPAPALPEGTQAPMLAGFLFLASLGIGALLAALAAHVTGNFVLRWTLLTLFGWVIYSVGTYIEARIFTTFESASLYKVVMDMVAFAICSFLAAWFFAPSAGAPAGLPVRSVKDWVWRVAAAWLAFPVIYLMFGRLVEPYVIDVYRQGQMELAAPGWGQILTAQGLRSALFLVVSLWLIARWKGSRDGLYVALSVGLFLLVGGFYMLQAYWFPVNFRMIHSAEMLADALVYALVLVRLFGRKGEPAVRPVTNHASA